eukprot:scaffold98626_cov18-Prasinocladus_malaysianus.AAC.1
MIFVRHFFARVSACVISRLIAVAIPFKTDLNESDANGEANGTKPAVPGAGKLLEERIKPRAGLPPLLVN